jgi:hypothetical protein
VEEKLARWTWATKLYASFGMTRTTNGDTSLLINRLPKTNRSDGLQKKQKTARTNTARARLTSVSN